MAHHTAADLNLQPDPKQLKPLFRKKTHKHVGALLFDWAVIAATIYFCIQFFHPVLYMLAVIIIGARMHALAILMHDATHFQFLKNRKWNDLLTNLVTMYPLFTSIEQYRDNHMRHHRHLNSEHDPDWVSKFGKKEFTFPKSRGEFLFTLFTYLVLYQGVKDAVWFLKRFQAPKKKAGKKPGNARIRVLYSLSLLTAVTLLGIWPYFLMFWVVPYLSTFFMFQYIRSVAEHFGELAYDNLLTSTRTVRATWVERFFIAPHQVSYHLEHHLYPGVPFYNLPQLHELLMQESEYRNKAHITQGYLSGLLTELSSKKMEIAS